MRRTRARDERGFTMLLALYVLTITTLLLGAAYVAVLSDTHLSRNDLDQKRAYAAAQAGIAQYNYDLNQNPNYWENCASPSGTVGARRQRVDRDLQPTRRSSRARRRTAPRRARPSNPIGTMVEAATLTGGGSNPRRGHLPNRLDRHLQQRLAHDRRAVQARQLPELRLLHRLRDARPGGPAGRPHATAPATTPTAPDAAATAAARSTSSARTRSTGRCTARTPSRSAARPTFGRTAADSIQAAGFADESSCGGSAPYYGAILIGTYTSTAPSLLPPPTDGQLLNVAQTGGTVYTGTTTIALTGTTATVTNANLNGGSPTSVNLASTNGVIYVQSAQTPVCAEIYTPFTANADLRRRTWAAATSTSAATTTCR